MTKFILFMIMNLDMVDRNSAPEEFACIWQCKRFGIIMIETEKMWIHFFMRRFRGCQPSWYLLQYRNSLIFTQDVTDASVNTCCIVLYFWTSTFSFRADSILKSDGDFISKWKFPDCVHFFDAWARQAMIETIAVVYELTAKKNTGEIVRPLGTIIQSIFLSPIRSRHLLGFVGRVRWETVPRGSFVRT